MKTIHAISILFLFQIYQIELRSQGCSDAGFCTLNTLKTNTNDLSDAQTLNIIKFGAIYGKADHAISIYSGYLEYGRSVTDHFNLNAKLYYMAQQGNLAKSSGLSDLYVSANYYITEKTNFTAGLKIPLSDGNNLNDGMALPMDYQISLGTYDLIIGGGYALKNINFSFALQQPLTQNKNTFLVSDYPPGSGFEVFHSTNQYKRKGDIFLRVAYKINIGNNLIITPGILPIYHLGNDEYTNMEGVVQEIEGSAGLTLNANLFFRYSFTTTSKIELSAGMPFITRDARPDGLTREFVIGLEYTYNF